MPAGLGSGGGGLAWCWQGRADVRFLVELEDAEPGERLTRRGSWHPVDTAHVFDVARALEQPRSLDESKELELGDSFVEIHSAAFGERDTLVLACSGLEGEEMTGRILEQWPELHTGCHGSGLIHHLPPSPPFALDPAGRRFAVADGRGARGGPHPAGATVGATATPRRYPRHRVEVELRDALHLGAQ